MCAHTHQELGVDALDSAGFAAESAHVPAAAPSTRHLVVTPGDGLTAEAGYLRYVCCLCACALR